jgi:predicted RNA binding protein YcfA (HicA-like mRNA interferase family)
VPDGGRRLRNVRSSNAIRAFEKLGYELVRVRGSHHVLRKPGHGLLSLPVHKGRIKAGIILDALKKAGISPDEFEKYL